MKVNNQYNPPNRYWLLLLKKGKLQTLINYYRFLVASGNWAHWVKHKVVFFVTIFLLFWGGLKIYLRIGLYFLYSMGYSPRSSNFPPNYALPSAIYIHTSKENSNFKTAEGMMISSCDLVSFSDYLALSTKVLIATGWLSHSSDPKSSSATTSHEHLHFWPTSCHVKFIKVPHSLHLTL